MQNKDFNLYASVNVTYNQNKIEGYGGVDEVAVRYEAGGLARVLKVGNSVDAIYARPIHWALLKHKFNNIKRKYLCCC